MATLLGGIEFGGTKTVCVVGAPGEILAEKRFATGAVPAQTLDACADFFSAHGPVAGLGIGAFGPLRH